MPDKLPFELNAKGIVSNRESSNLEFKANFHHGDNLVEYCRSMVGMANNKGGRIIFGVEDNPRKPIGMTNRKFIECDPSKINSCLLDHFSHEIEWELETVEYNSCIFGVIHIKEADTKPVLCKKAKSGILREGAVYYRYRGETKEIQYAELTKILDEEKKKERLLWMKHIEKIAIAGPQNAYILDTLKGELQTDKGKILIDESLIDKIKFIKEGQFTQREGTPTLRLIGDIEGLSDDTNVIASDALYPLLQNNLCSELILNQYEMTCVIWKLGIKNKSKYHSEIKSGESSSVHKYSNRLVPLIRRLLEKDPQFLTECINEYKESHPHSRKKKIRNNGKR